MNRKSVRFHYDTDADVMYLSIGKPRKAKTVELTDDFVLRLDPRTGEAIGLTIIDFSRHFPALARSGQIPRDGKLAPESLLEAIEA